MSTEDYADICEPSARLCAQFPGEYRRKPDREMATQAFVAAMTKPHLLGAGAEKYGGSGLKLSAGAAVLEEIQRAGCNGGGCHAQMNTLGTAAARLRCAEGQVAAEDRSGELGCKPSASTADSAPIHLAQDHRAPRRRPLRFKPEDLDQPRRAFRLMILLRAPRRATRKETHRGVSVHHRQSPSARVTASPSEPIRTMMNHATTEVFFDNMNVRRKIPRRGREGFR